jgi:hypothetical protein
VRTTEELLGRNSSGFGLENREYVRGGPLRWPRNNLYPQKLALTSPTSGGRSVGRVLLLTKATEFFCFVAWRCRSGVETYSATFLIYICFSDSNILVNYDELNKSVIEVITF